MRIGLVVGSFCWIVALAGAAEAALHLPSRPLRPATERSVSVAPRSQSCLQPLFDRIFARTAAAPACNDPPPAGARRRIG